MPIFALQDRFVPAILAGAKLQTIRATRRCQPGAVMQLYAGSRFKPGTYHRLTVVECVLVDRVTITPAGAVYERPGLHPVGQDEGARWDGFADWPDMAAWFEQVHGLPFAGFVHRWQGIPRTLPLPFVPPVAVAVAP